MTNKDISPRRSNFLCFTTLCFSSNNHTWEIARPFHPSGWMGQLKVGMEKSELIRTLYEFTYSEKNMKLDISSRERG